MRLVAVQVGRGDTRYGGGRRSPLGLGGTVAVHAIVIGAFILMPREVIDFITPSKPLTTRNIPLPPPDPIVERKTDAPVETQARENTQPTVTDPFVALPRADPPLAATTGIDEPVDTGPSDTGPVITISPVEPPHVPVLTEASIDPRAMARFQPDYPGAMIRQGMDGTVMVRVMVGADGRVTDIARLSATDESFWLATRRHALRNWRFRPATRDGVAIPSTRILTVHFTLTDR